MAHQIIPHTSPLKDRLQPVLDQSLNFSKSTQPQLDWSPEGLDRNCSPVATDGRSSPVASLLKSPRPDFGTLPKTNPLQLFNLVCISHRYEFRSIKAWAPNALALAYTRLMHPPNNKDGEGPSLEQFTELASHCELAVHHQPSESCLSFYNGIKVSTILPTSGRELLPSCHNMSVAGWHLSFLLLNPSGSSPLCTFALIILNMRQSIYSQSCR